MYLIYLSIAWILGILTGLLMPVPLWSLALCILPLLLLLIPGLRKFKSVLLFCCLGILIIFAGNIRFISTLPEINEHHIQFYNDGNILEIEGMIVNEPEKRDRNLLFHLSTEKISTDIESIYVTGKILVYTPRYSEYHYGDVLRIEGQPKTPSEFDDFSYKDYLARQGIYSVMYYPEIKIIESGKGSKILSYIYNLRNSLSQNLTYVLPEPQCSLAQGILLGYRTTIPQSIVQNFRVTGTSHLLAISGLHLSIIIGILLSASIWLFGRRYSIYIWLALLIIWLYAILTGMRPPVVRSAFMGSMFLFSELLGRQRSASTALIFTAAILIGMEPQVLWDVSFQLSFLAFAGLIFIFPHLQNWLRTKLINTGISSSLLVSLFIVLADSLAVTMAAVLFTWPVIAYHFGTISLIFLPANLLAVPVLPLLVISAMLVSFTGFILPILSQFFGWIAWLFYSYLIFIVNIFALLPFAKIEMKTIQLWQIAIYYVVLIAAIALLAHKQPFSRLITSTARKIEQQSVVDLTLFSNRIKVGGTVFLFICVLFVWTLIPHLPDGKLQVSFLNVGQGDAILIQTPQDQKILIDGGPSPQAIKVELGKKLPFWDRTIDLMILTQPQLDHIAGQIEILQQYTVKHIISTELQPYSYTHREWLRIIGEKDIRYDYVYAGQEIVLGDNLKIEVLHPSSEIIKNTFDDIDNLGLVLRLNYDKVSFLLTADIKEETEWEMITERASLRSTALKVAHHGSHSSTSLQFLSVVKPEVAIVSVGKDNPFGHPHPDAIARLSHILYKNRIFITSENGTVDCITDGSRLWIKIEAP